MTENRISVGVLKTLNIFPYSSEQLLTPTQAPTTISTGSPQASWTFQKSAMAPYFSGNVNVISYRPLFGLALGGQNTSGVAVTVFMQINKNGIAYKSANLSIPNSNYFCVTIAEGSSDGDKYDFYIWSSATTGLNYSYQCCWCAPTRLDTGAKYLLNYTSSATSLVDNTAVLPLANANRKVTPSWTGAVQFYPVPSNSVNVGSNIVNSPVTIPLYASHPTYKLYSLQGLEGAIISGLNADATSYRATNNNYIYSLSYREIIVGK